MIDVGNCWPAAAYDDLLAGLLVKRGFVYSACLFGMEWDCEFVSGGWMDGRMDSRVNKDLLTVKEL